MWVKRKAVLCSNCGFLGWQNIAPDGSYISSQVMECGPQSRFFFQTSEGHSGGAVEDPETHDYSELRCGALQWRLCPDKKWETDFALSPETIKQSRQCPYYIKYQPGFSPEEHKELKRDNATRSALVKAALIGAAVGAFAAIVAQLLYIRFGP